MIQESDIVPFHVSPPQGNKALVLAPHPDDETLGCGGTIRLLLQRKTPVKVVFLTSGDKADPSHKLSHVVHYKNPPAPSFLTGNKKGLHNNVSGWNHITRYALLREKEAVKALRVLGVSDCEFFRFPDRELNTHFDSALEKLSRVVTEYNPDTIYSPSVIELNPDHRATASLSLEIQKSLAGREGCVHIDLMFYEVTTPLRPNMLVDVTSVYPIKKRAIKKYKSQLKISDYLRYITALNSFRALTVKGPGLVEAFWHIDNLPRGNTDIAQWLCYNRDIDRQ